MVRLWQWRLIRSTQVQRRRPGATSWRATPPTCSPTRPATSSEEARPTRSRSSSWLGPRPRTLRRRWRTATKTASPTTPLPKSPNFDEADVSDKPEWVQSYPRLSPAEIDDLQTLYRERLRSMLSVEDLLEQTISTLQETGELDNTYIFFTSDNGFHLGQHRLGCARGKKTPYEEDIGVPLMVRGPGVPAGEVRQAAGHKQRLCAHHRRPGRRPYPRVRRRELFRPAADRLAALLLALGFLGGRVASETVARYPNSYTQERPHPGSHVHGVRDRRARALRPHRRPLPAREQTPSGQRATLLRPCKPASTP